MLGQVQPTRYDLYFSVFGIPVRVVPTFWLAGVLTGWNTIDDPNLGPAFLFIWIACLFVSILIHELGHAFAARAFGWPPQVFLYHFGGLAAYAPYGGHTTGRSVFISFAGPGAGFILYGLVLAVEFALIQTRTPIGLIAFFTIIQLKWINLTWGLVNLLPVLPLDGGRICESLCEHVRPRDGRDIAIKIAIATSAVVAFFFFTHRDEYGLFPGLLFAMLCVQNVQDYQMQRGRW
ncbi:MAG: site-2 protease family protein [Planctomycetaceae bacterium]